MAYDYEAHSIRIEDSLRCEDCAAIADRLENARLAGATGGEILMALSYECRTALNDAMVSDAVKTDIVSLLRRIKISGF